VTNSDERPEPVAAVVTLLEAILTDGRILR
jgi:hypothetical protein